METGTINAIVKVKTDLSCEILKTFESEENSIHYLVNHINKEYELKENITFKVYQKSNTSFEIYRIGYLYKVLECKYHIVTIESN
jgi:hypothetical protein